MNVEFSKHRTMEGCVPFSYKDSNNQDQGLLEIVALVCMLASMLLRIRAFAWIGLLVNLSLRLNRSKHSQSNPTQASQMMMSFMALIMSYVMPQTGSLFSFKKK
eukprot:TRINITY_DN1900_c0_g2_i1.p1 TRINITY_DN1900_c0_g2~~TRINITY_DN1900_c0_g2_i1.p1  ORF type:complete len:115 (-),score=21.96 TRINITY_DN1900_c0_g2_i1:56-367(-)